MLKNFQKWKLIILKIIIIGTGVGSIAAAARLSNIGF